MRIESRRSKIETRYDIGDTVYLKTDPDQKPRIITSVCVYAGHNYLYNLACGEDMSGHYEFEIQEQRDELKALGVNVSSDE